MQVTMTDVSVRLGPRQILDGLTAEFKREATAVMGPSGSGKSTLLGVIGGLISPDLGSVCRQPSTMPIEWLIQSTPLLSRRTVLDNVMLSARMRGVPEALALEQAREAMAAVGIHEMESARAWSLSGGEKQRVAIARAMTSRAPLLLADEPTASLDPATRALVSDAFRAAASRAIVIIATHDAFVAEQCDSVYDLVAGRLVRRS